MHEMTGSGHVRTRWYTLAIVFFGLLILTLVGLSVRESRGDWANRILRYKMRSYYKLVLERKSLNPEKVTVESTPEGTIHLALMPPSPDHFRSTACWLPTVYRGLLESNKDWLFDEPHIIAHSKSESTQKWREICPKKLINYDDPNLFLVPAALKEPLDLQQFLNRFYLIDRLLHNL
jgi:hypothetical protein